MLLLSCVFQNCTTTVPAPELLLLWSLSCRTSSIIPYFHEIMVKNAPSLVLTCSGGLRYAIRGWRLCRLFLDKSHADKMAWIRRFCVAFCMYWRKCIPLRSWCSLLSNCLLRNLLQHGQIAWKSKTRWPYLNISNALYLCRSYKHRLQMRRWEKVGEMRCNIGAIR
jgi:hypothetical protein